MLQTLQTGTVESKRADAVWAEHALDRRWNWLINRAWDVRPGNALWKVRQKADPIDFEANWAFMEHAVALGRQWKQGNFWKAR